MSTLLGALFILTLNCMAQDPEDNTLQNDTVIIEGNILVDTAKQHKHNPKIAIWASVFVPGLGQAYNQKYWKIPIIWGAGLGLYTYYDYNNKYYLRFKEAYEQTQNGEPVTDPGMTQFSENALKQNRDAFRRHRDRAIIFSGLLYVANIIDAMVDAHMFNYDISDDLSIFWQPTITPAYPELNLATTYGVNIRLKF